MTIQYLQNLVLSFFDASEIVNYRPRYIGNGKVARWTGFTDQRRFLFRVFFDDCPKKTDLPHAPTPFTWKNDLCNNTRFYLPTIFHHVPFYYFIYFARGKQGFRGCRFSSSENFRTFELRINVESRKRNSKRKYAICGEKKEKSEGTFYLGRRDQGLR